MSDYGDFCREQREHRQAVRRRAAEDNLAYRAEMETLGGKVVKTLPSGLRFEFKRGLRVDFWPSSGKWTVVGSNVYRVGPRQMVEHVKAQLNRPAPLPDNAPRESSWKGTPTGPGNPPWRTL